MQGEGGCYREVSQSYEICLLGVEVNKTPDAVRVSIDYEKSLIILTI